MMKNSNTDRDDYSFINEVIKKKPADKKKIALYILSALAFVAVAAALAALVFVKVTSIAENRWSGESSSKIEIPKDDEPGNDQGENSGSQTDEGETEGSSDSEEGSDEEVTAEDIEVTLSHYEELCAQMEQIAADRQDTFVRIVGVESEVDYFNESYQNTQETTGLIVANNDSEVYILAASDSLSSEADIQVMLPDSVYVDASIVRADKETGLVVVSVPKNKIPGSIRGNLQTAVLGNSYFVKRGQPVIAIGEMAGYKETVSFGHITSIGNLYPYYDIQYSLIATDIQMNSSGGRGFLMNMDGEIIGVITKKTVPSDVSVYTAIGISELKNLIERLSNGEKEVYIGVKAEEITDTVSRRTEMPKGMLVKEVQNDGPAMLAGILPMDIITEIDGNEIIGYSAYRAWLRSASPGEVVKIKALRSGKEGYEEAVFEVTVGER